MLFVDQPLTRPLIALTKKYLSLFSELTNDLSLKRYHFVLLRIDENKERLTQKALAELMLVDKSTMVNIIDYLSERGYVLREKNEKDRREQLIRLTPKAKQDLLVIRSAVAELNNRSVRDLSAEQLTIFNDVLETIQSNLSDSVPSNIILQFTQVSSSTQ